MPLRALQMRDVVLIECEPPSRPFGNDSLSLNKFDRLIIEFGKPGHVFEVDRVRQSAQHLKAGFRKQVAGDRNIVALRHVPDAHKLAYTADALQIGHQDVGGAQLQHAPETVARIFSFPARYWRVERGGHARESVEIPS